VSYTVRPLRPRVSRRHVGWDARPGTIYGLPDSHGLSRLHHPCMISNRVTEDDGQCPLSILPQRVELAVVMRDFDILAATDWVAGGFALVLLTGLALSRLGSKPQRVYPPGPPRHPIWGNLFNFPLRRWHETFTEWQKSWGMSYSRSLLSFRCRETRARPSSLTTLAHQANSSISAFLACQCLSSRIEGSLMSC